MNFSNPYNKAQPQFLIVLVYQCQTLVHSQVQEVHLFLEQVVANIRGQASFLSNVLTKQNAMSVWQTKTDE
jgi:hypothetical protein